MTTVVRILPALVLLSAAAAPAHAGRITLGSDLKAPATVTLAQGADTAYWLTSLSSGSIRIPANGQVVQVRVKGSAMREPNAKNDPATMVHFQSLGRAGENGARQVYLTSAAAYLPVDQPDAISSFEPENLCVRKGGAVTFNTIGGHKWGGSLTAPLVHDQYLHGTPWRIFAKASAATAWFSKDNGTKNGHTLTPHGGTNARDGYGGVTRGQELLMQVVVATGSDRSEPCGGPRRHPDGTLVAPKVRELRVAGGQEQRPYVTKDRRFTTGVYCETPGLTCKGRAILKIGRRAIAKRPVEVPTQSSLRVPMRLGRSDFRQLDRRGYLRVTYVLVSQFGKTKIRLSLNR